MEYTYLPIENTDLFELRAENFIFILDSADPMYDKMIEDFNESVNIERFITLLISDPSTAFEIYNSSN
jgi:hypothetical protein